MFTAPVRKISSENKTIVPVLLEIRQDGGRVEFAPNDDLPNIQPEYSLELDAETCWQKLPDTSLRKALKDSMKAGGKQRRPDLIEKFGGQ